MFGGRDLPQARARGTRSPSAAGSPRSVRRSPRCVLITGCAAVASNSSLGDPAPDAAGDHHAEAGTDDTATAATTEGATTESGHAHDETAATVRPMATGTTVADTHVTAP